MDVFSRETRNIAKWIERLLAIGILASILMFTYHSAIAIFHMDWSQAETFYEMINRTLLIVIGVELIRTLITHDLGAIVELLAFVIARKLLKPDLANFEIILSVVSFAGLLAARKYLLNPEED